MKHGIRAVCILLAATLAMACIPMESRAEIIDKRTWNGFVYTGFDTEEIEAELEGRPVDKSAIELEILNYAGNEREVAIPTEIDGMKVVSVMSLSRAKNLRTLHIPNGVEVHWALARAPKLRKITVSPDNRRYSVKNNALLNKKGTTLMGYPGGRTTLKVPDSVVRIAETFEGKKIKKIRLGKNVKKIGYMVFSRNTGLETLVLDRNVQYIGDNAFKYCRKLKKVVLGKSVKRIGYDAFCRCGKLKKIYIYNKKCKICELKDANVPYTTISRSATVYGWKGSTAERYAKKYGLKFKVISPH